MSVVARSSLEKIIPDFIKSETILIVSDCLVVNFVMRQKTMKNKTQKLKNNETDSADSNRLLLSFKLNFVYNMISKKEKEVI